MFFKPFPNSLIWTGVLALAAVAEVQGPLVCRWSPHDSGSNVVARNGVNFFSLASRGVTVEATAEDTGHEIRVDVRIENQSETSITVDPAVFSFEILSPKLKQLKFEPVEKVASRYMSAAGPIDRMGTGVTFSRTPESVDNGAAQLQAGRVRQTALRPISLAPNQATMGAVYFEREKKKEGTMLLVPLGKMTFEFPFSWSDGRVLVPQS
jgi:hypothetical protein